MVSNLAWWFRSFYYDLASVTIIWYQYRKVLEFEIPFKFNFDGPLIDDELMIHFLTFISPCLLFVNISSNRSQTISYEFYHLSHLKISI
jgi:hypothetical protein